MAISHRFAGRSTTGARTTGQGRAEGTAAQPRTLEAAPASAGSLDQRHERPLDFAYLKRVISLGMVLARYGVELRPVGSQHAGCCPLHNGSDPRQFVVHLASNNWFCFGDCNRGGSMLDFVALKERVSIAQAAKLVAEWFALGPPRHLPPRPRVKRRTAMSSARPSHRAYAVDDRDQNASAEQPSYWTRIGVCFPHKDGKGLSIVLSALPVNGRIVLREYSDEDEQREQSKPRKSAGK